MSMFTTNRCLVVALALFVSTNSLQVAHAHDHGDYEEETTYTASWDAKASLPEKRSDMTASTVDDKIYIIGGCDQHQVRPPLRHGRWSSALGIALDLEPSLAASHTRSRPRAHTLFPPFPSLSHAGGL